MTRHFRTIAVLLFLTLFGIFLQGYHPGAEDDGIYLSAIKRDLNPRLYPFNADFITLQGKATIYDKVIATATRSTHVPVGYVCLILQVMGILLLLAGCWWIVAYCLPSFRARLAGVLTITCLLSLPVAGTAVYLADESLHPRLLATDLILFAIGAMQRGHRARAAVWLLLSCLFHPIMGAFGVSFCLIYGGSVWWERVRTREELPLGALKGSSIRAGVVPGAYLFRPANGAWRNAMGQHHYLLLSQWAWYEWLGALAPPLLLYGLFQLGRRTGNERFRRMAGVALVFSAVQLALALLMLLPSHGIHLAPLQPMRYLHLTFLFLFLLGGAALGEYVLRASTVRWALVFVPLAAVNGWAAHGRYPATPNLELPGTAPANNWLRAFAWVRTHTPEDAVFAMDPDYLSMPGVDNHSFRALAERSSLADRAKDSAVVTQGLALAEVWQTQQEEQNGWRRWSREDFGHLAAMTPARWVLVAPEQSAGLPCPYTTETVDVCRIAPEYATDSAPQHAPE